MNGFKIGDLVIGEKESLKNTIWRISKENFIDNKMFFIVKCLKGNRYYKTGYFFGILKTRICEKFKLFEIVPTEKILKNWI